MNKITLQKKYLLVVYYIAWYQNKEEKIKLGLLTNLALSKYYGKEGKIIC